MPNLLEIGSILRRFDGAQLRALTGASDQDLALFLADGDVEAVPEAPGCYQVRPAARAAALAGLRASRPGDEAALHRRAFDYLLARLRAGLPAERRIADEDDCLYHLDAIFTLVGAEMDWRQITERSLAVRAIGSIQPRHRQRLALYEGYAAIRMQDYTRGEALLAALLAEPPLDGDVVIKAIKGLADAAVFHADHERARELYDRLHEVARTAGDPSYQGLALVNLGLVHHELGDNALALAYCERARPHFAANGDERREAHVLYHLALFSLHLGRWEAAREYGAAAERLFERLGLQSFLGYVSWLRGVTAHAFGELAASDAAYHHALALAGEQPGQALLAMDARLYLGLLYQTQDRPAEAAREYGRALDLASRLDQRHRACMIRYRLGQLHWRRSARDAALAAFRAALEQIEALREATEREDIKIGLLGTVQQIYEATVLLCLELDRPAEAFDVVERARSRAFLDTLIRKSPELYDAVDQPVATLAEVQTRLPEDALLLEYFTTGVLPRGEHLLNALPPQGGRLREHLTLPPQILIFAVTRDRCEVHRAPLDPNALRPPAHDPVPGRRFLHGRPLARLHEALIAPVGHLLGGRRQLYLIPHGPLHYVPFLALRSAAGAHLLDARGPAVALAPSATILLRNCLGRARRPADGTLALGYNGRGEATLRYAEAEARHVARVTGGRAWAGPEPKGAHLLAAARAGERVRWLHFAGHAVYDPREPLDSALQLGEGDALSARAIIAGLDVRAELVTLSACTSGLSHVVPGDELLGLQRALLYAGAPAVVCTLWEATDLVTLLVMERFYAALRRGATPAAALRDAQVATRAMTGRALAATLARWRAEDPDLAAALGDPADPPPDDADARPFADPFYWAPFMLIGRPD